MKAMNTPNRIMATISAPIGMATDSAARRRRSPRKGEATALRTGSTMALSGMFLDLAYHALDQIVHLLQRDVGLNLLRARNDDSLAGVVFERSFEDHELTLDHLRLDGVRVLAAAFGHGVTVWGCLDVAFLESAAEEV